MFYEFKGHRPMVDASAFVHPQAAVTGNVVIGKNVYIGPGAAIRGDWGKIVIEDGCNVQENCTIHMFPGVTVLLKEGAHIGHGAIVHGATIGRNCLVGMNSVIMDGVEVGDECIVGALSFIKAGEKIPGRSVVVGNPAKIVKEVSEEMLRWKTEGTAIYQALPGDMYGGWKVCEPRRLREENMNEGDEVGGREVGIEGDGRDPASGKEAGIEEEEVREPASGEMGGDEGMDLGKEYRPWKETAESKAEEPAAVYGIGKRRFSVEDYLRMESESLEKHEYYKGEIFLMSGARMDHNIITSNLMGHLHPKLENSPCQVFGSDLRIYVEANGLFTYPDLSIVCGEPVTRANDDLHLMNPSVIIEVLSPSTKDYDRGDKFKLYQGLSTLSEYVLVDSKSVLVEHFIKNAGGEWGLQKYGKTGDNLSIRAAGVSISLREIYARTQFPKLTH
ncbi:MAG TPA: Uma2 family endonuclease [Puia sp.]|jgi:phenylacetic acid degradation protein/carnitine operon protein CaiE